jgi:acetyl esterase/lipase
VSDRFLSRQLVQLGLTANALRPVPGGPASVPAFFAGWLTAELAPQWLALTLADGALNARLRKGRGRRDLVGLAAWAANLGIYADLIVRGRRADQQVEAALVEALGARYRDELNPASLPDDAVVSNGSIARTIGGSLAMPFHMSEPNVKRVRGLRYADGGRRFELDVYHRADMPADAPVLLQIHGGGWVIGNKDQQGIPLMTHLAARGWACVSVNYPLSPRARWPEHLIALKRAVAWIREHISDYGGDPDFLAVTGGSAGGHLAAMVALTVGDLSLQPGFEDADTSVQACVPFYGVYDFTEESGKKYTTQRLESLIRPMVMASDARYPEDYLAASPYYRADADAPPFLVVHGTNDTLVPVDDARTFVARLREVSKNPVGYAELAGAQHAFEVFPSVRTAPVIRGVTRFLEWCHANQACEDVERAG